MLSRRLLQSAALIMLLLAGSEIFLCQLWSPESCEFSQTNRGEDDTASTNDDCLCCCLVDAHQAPMPEPSNVTVMQPETIYTTGPVPAPAAVYHPPVV